MKAQSTNDNSRKPYNDEPLLEGEVLVPMLVDDRQYAIAIGAKPKNFRTWTTAGISYTVMFVPVPTEHAVSSTKAFYAAVNELLDLKLGSNRYSRCLVPQTNGTLKICPKVSNGNHAPCAFCPHKSEYEREDRSIVSIEELDEENYHPMKTVPSSESVSMEKFLLDDLLAYLGSINPVLAEVASLGFDGFDKKEVIQQLPVQKSQAYSIYNKAEQLAREFLRK